MINENEEVYIDLSRFWETFKKVSGRCIVITIILTVLAFSFSAFMIKPDYTSTSRIIIVQSQNNTETSQSVTYNDIQLSQKLVNTYTEIARSSAVLEDVIKSLDLDMTVDQLNDALTIKAVNNTEIIDISVTTHSAKQSAKIANQIVENLKEAVYKIMNFSNVMVLNEAKVPTEKSGPSNVKNGLIGTAVGIIISGAIVVIKTLTDTKVKTEDEVKAIFDYPVIGIIPNFELDKYERGNE